MMMYVIMLTKKSLQRNKIPTFEQVDIEHAFGGARLIDKIAIDGSDLSVEILPSATRHGQSKEDILNALERSIYDETLESDPNKTLAIGYDGNAKLLEVIFHVLSDEHIVVFHSMPCRKHYIERMGK